ncbi:MAG: GNAT family N-acetyltransferase, partial [Alphaproteobacteria bacterium]
MRKANSSDVECIVNIHRAARAQAMPWLPVLHTKEEDLKHFRTRVFPDQTVSVVTLDGKVVGFTAYK